MNTARASHTGTSSDYTVAHWLMLVRPLNYRALHLDLLWWRALQDARSSQRNLCAIWIDLANAYGSVHHKLIDFSLNYYHMPPKCKEIVQCIYRDLSVSIKSNSWQTCLIPIRKGVFQGDPLSVIIFNIVINLYVDVISQPLYNSLSYQYSYVNGQLFLSQFANDTCLVSNSVSSCQFLTNISCQFFAWALMKVNVAKCRCLAISSRSKQTVFDPELIIGDKSVPFIGSTIFKFLGLPLDMNLTPEATKELLVSRLRYLAM